MVECSLDVVRLDSARADLQVGRVLVTRIHPVSLANVTAAVYAASGALIAALAPGGVEFDVIDR